MKPLAIFLSFWAFSLHMQAQKIEVVSTPEYPSTLQWPTQTTGTWTGGVLQPLSSYTGGKWKRDWGQLAGLNRVTNPLCGVYETSNGTTWLAFEKLSGNNDGPFWGSTNGGLVRIQNQTPLLFNKENLPFWSGIEDKEWTILSGQKGDTALWVGTEKGIRKMRLPNLSTTFFPFTQLDTFPHQVTRSCTGPAGQVWFWGTEGKLICAGSGPLSYFDQTRFGLQGKRIADACLPDQGDTLLLASSGLLGDSLFKFHLYRIHENQVQNLSTSLAISSLSLTQLACESNTQIFWLADEGGNVFRIENGQVLKFSNLSLPGNEITDLNCGPDGRKWISATQSGLSVWSDFNPGPFASDSLVGSCQKTIAFADSGKSIRNAPISRTWIWGDGDSSTSQTATHAYEKAGIYKVKSKTRQANILYEDSLQIEVRWIPAMELSTQSDTINTCKPDSVGAYFGKQAINWSTPSGFLSTMKVLPSEPGLYTASSTWLGCTESKSIYYTKPEIPDGKISVWQQDGIEILGDQLLKELENVQLRIEPNPGYCMGIWFKNDVQLAENVSELPLTWSATDEEIRLRFEFMLPSGCQGMWERTLTLAEKPRLEIPNLITADQNNRNEFFQIPQLPYYPDNQLSIYNRWGKEVFQAAPYLNNWPNQSPAEGSYFYSLRAGGKVYSGWLWVVKGD